MTNWEEKYPINTFYGETKRELLEVIYLAVNEFKEKVKKDIEKEISEAHLNGESTSRLTRLFNNLK